MADIPVRYTGDLFPTHETWEYIHHPCDTPDELQFCDEDIRAAFRGRIHPIGVPTQVQLIREVRLLRETMAEYLRPKAVIS